ncbi:MAG: hypothetical protein Q7R41_04225, partial [Phycisphaerales bacterium]|nr:hypothetical protein [Phycisphaerales bacterium]
YSHFRAMQESTHYLPINQLEDGCAYLITASGTIKDSVVESSSRKLRLVYQTGRSVGGSGSAEY